MKKNSVQMIALIIEKELSKKVRNKKVFHIVEECLQPCVGILSSSIDKVGLKKFSDLIIRLLVGSKKVRKTSLRNLEKLLGSHGGFSELIVAIREIEISLDINSGESVLLRSSCLYGEEVKIFNDDVVACKLPDSPRECEIATVYYATNRQPTDATGIYHRFSGERGEKISYGSAEISIPKRHKRGQFETPIWWKLEFRIDPDRHVAIKEILNLSEQEFFGNIKECTDRVGKQAFVYLHGYNVDFDEALRRAGQLFFDLNCLAAPILFSWPSVGKISGYLKDRENAKWSQNDLCCFLKNLQIHGGYEKISIISHSMGGRALLYALGTILEDLPSVVHYSQIAFFAPDVDRDIFGRAVPKISSLAHRVTLYASNQDMAMLTSRQFNGGVRAGDMNGGPVLLSCLDTIDASNVRVDFLGHSYHSNSRCVVSDLFYLLRGIPINERDGLNKKYINGQFYWEFQP